MNNLSFQEKSLWASLVAMVLVYGLYYLNVLPPVDGNMQSPHIWQFFKYMGLLVIIVAIGQIAVLIKNKEEPVDERQKMIELKAGIVSSYILHGGVVVAIFVAFWVPGNFWFIHTINLVAVLAEVINYIQQLRAFRKGF